MMEHPKRRFLAICVLFLAATVLVVGSGVLSLWLPYHREQVAIAEIERLDGSVDVYESGRPEWLQGLLGDRLIKIFDRAGAVVLTDTSADDAVLAHCGALTCLQSLELDNSRVAGQGLRHLE